MLEAQVNLASTVRLEWLEELFPEHIRLTRATRYDESRQRVMSTNQLWYHDLLLREDVLPGAEPETASSHLATALRAQAASIFLASPNAAQWLSRAEFLRRTLPELDLPDFNDEVFADLLEAVCQGKSRMEEVERTDLIPFLRSRLTPVQVRALQEHAPIALAAER